MQIRSLIASGSDLKNPVEVITNFDRGKLVAGLAQEGFNLIELGGDLGLFFPSAYESKNIQRLETLKHELGLSYTLHLPLWSVEPSTPLKPVRLGSVQAILDVINAVKPLDPEFYILHATGALAAEFYRMNLPENIKSLVLRQFQSGAINSIKTILERSGLPSRKLAIETIEFPFDLTLEIAELLDLSICLDTGHVLAGFSGPISLHDALTACSHRLAEIHLHDSPNFLETGQLAYGKDHQALGMGALDTNRLFQFLDEQNFTGPIIFELTVEEAKNSILFLRESGVLIVTDFSLPYGKSQLNLAIPDQFKTDLLMPATLPPLPDPSQAIDNALANTIGRKKLSNFSEDKTVGIAINDKTRPVPRPNPLNGLLAYLEEIGFRKENISIFIGSGTHTPMQWPEYSQILDEEIIRRYHILAHDCDNTPMVDLGETAHRTPVLVNEDYFNCDLKITIGNIEPHHFMGFSGGVKTAAIGLVGRETINANHSMLTHPQAKSGVYNINPMRQDIEEIGQKIKIDFSLGTILNERKQIMKVFFGEPGLVMDAAIPTVRDNFGITVENPYDLVIASPGGAPKDINLYQAQKGLTHAARITRDGGWVILLAACPEGSGSKSYEKFISGMESHQAVLDQFETGFFQVGPHKAFQIARDAVRVNIVIVSDIPPNKIKQWKLTPSNPQLLQQLINWIAVRLPPNARVAVLPASTRTMTEVIRHG